MASDASNLFSDDSSQGFDLGEEQERNIEFTPYESVYDLCRNDRQLSENELVEQLERILETDPDVLRETDERGNTLLRNAIMYQRSLNFCKLLIDHNPDLVRTTDNDGSLPIHIACWNTNNELIKFLIDQYPESVNIPDANDFYPDMYPVHCYIVSDGDHKRLDVLNFLLKCDEKAVSTPDTGGFLPLHSAIMRYDASVDMVEAVFNAYPQALFMENDDGEIPLEIVREDSAIIAYLVDQMELENQARQIMTPDETGQLPIHRALQSRFASLGTIKLMEAANPNSVSVADNDGMIPLHIASRCVDSRIVKFLIEKNVGSLNISDSKGNFPLHHACAGGNCDAVNFILSQSTQGVSIHNKGGKLPFELLLYEVSYDYFDEDDDQWRRDMKRGQEYRDTQERYSRIC